MIKRVFFLLVTAIALLPAVTITQMFDALKKQPQTRFDTTLAQFAKLGIKGTEDQFYPKIFAFGSYEHYNSPTNLRPLPPTELTRLGKSSPYPFAQTIERIGMKISMPIFVKELFTLKNKAKALFRSAKLKKQLNFYQNEAVILSADAELLYLKHLKKALEARKRSLQKTSKDLKIKVKNGRAAGIMLDMIEENINKLDIGINSVDIKYSLLVSQIEALTNLHIKDPASLELVSSLKTDDIFALKPLKFALEAKKYEKNAAYDKFYPKITAKALWSENYSQKDVLLNEDVHRGYGSYMIEFQMPLFDKNNFTNIQKAKISLQKEKFRLSKTKQELKAKAKALKKELVLFENSIKLARKSIANKKELLKYAKVAFKNGRMREEEYLRYEEGLLEAQSQYYEIIAKKWQSISQLAVIYGNDLKGIVK